MAALRRPKNLRNSFIHSSTSRRDIVVSRLCNIPRCMICTLVTSSTAFTSTITRKTYSILHNLSCHSHNINYLITCSPWNKQYVGLTSQTLRKRFNTNTDSTLTIIEATLLPNILTSPCTTSTTQKSHQ